MNPRRKECGCQRMGPLSLNALQLRIYVGPTSSPRARSAARLSIAPARHQRKGNGPRRQEPARHALLTPGQLNAAVDLLLWAAGLPFPYPPTHTKSPASLAQSEAFAPLRQTKATLVDGGLARAFVYSFAIH